MRRYRIEAVNCFAEFEFSDDGFREAVAFRASRSEFKGKRIADVLQTNPSAVPLGKALPRWSHHQMSASLGYNGRNCTSHVLTFGGRCLNCGYDPYPDRTHLERRESLVKLP